MLKIICDKSTKKLTFIVLGALANWIVLMILMAIFSYTFDLVASIITLFVVITCIALFVLGYYKTLKKSKNVIIIENDLIKYNYKTKLTIPICQILKVESDISKGSILNRIIIIHNYSGWKTSITINKSMIKKLSKAINMQIKFVGK